MKLSLFNNDDFDRGAPAWKEALWLFVSGLLVSSWIPGSEWRVEILKVFGASIGRNVVIKPYVKIKFPWRLTVGDFSWIGESVWIDNLDWVRIGSNVCISQAAYLCTGNHDFEDEAFKLITKPIVIEDEVWICAFSKIAPGVSIKKRSVIGFGSVLIKSTEENGIYSGNPAVKVRPRQG